MRNWKETIRLFGRHWFTFILIVLMTCAKTYMTENLNQELKIFLEELTAESAAVLRSGYVRTYQRELPNPGGALSGRLRNAGLRIINAQLDRRASLDSAASWWSRPREGDDLGGYADAFEGSVVGELDGGSADFSAGAPAGSSAEFIVIPAPPDADTGSPPPQPKRPGSPRRFSVEADGFEAYVAAHPYYSPARLDETRARLLQLRAASGPGLLGSLRARLPGFLGGRAAGSRPGEPPAAPARALFPLPERPSYPLTPVRQDVCGLELYVLHLVELLAQKAAAISVAKLLSLVVRISISQMQKFQRSYMRVSFASAMLAKSLQQPMATIDSGAADAIHIWEDSFDVSMLMDTLVNNFVPPIFVLASSFLLKSNFGGSVGESAGRSSDGSSRASGASSVVGSFSGTDWIMVLLALCPLPFQIRIVLSSESQSRAKMSSGQRRRAAVGNQLSETLGKSKLIKLYCTQDYEVQLLADKIDSHSMLVSQRMLLRERRMLAETLLYIFPHNVMLFYGFINVSTGSFSLAHARRLDSFIDMIYSQAKHLASSYSSFGEFYVTLLSIAESLGIPQEPEVCGFRDSLAYPPGRPADQVEAVVRNSLIAAGLSAQGAPPPSGGLLARGSLADRLADHLAGRLSSRLGDRIAGPWRLRCLRRLCRRPLEPEVLIAILGAGDSCAPAGSASDDAKGDAAGAELGISDLAPVAAPAFASADQKTLVQVDLAAYSELLATRLRITKISPSGPGTARSRLSAAPGGLSRELLRALNVCLTRIVPFRRAGSPGVLDTWCPPASEEPDRLFPPIEIRFSNVGFSYPARPDKRILDGFSLTIPPGTKIAIVGRTGAGKSTISQLLTRLYEPETGAIYFNGLPLNLVPLSLVRRLVTVLLQDNTMVPGTGLENLFYGSPQFRKLTRLLPKPPEEDDARLARKQRLRKGSSRSKKAGAAGEGGEAGQVVAETVGEEGPGARWGHSPNGLSAVFSSPLAHRLPEPSESMLSSTTSSMTSLSLQPSMEALSRPWDALFQGKSTGEALAREALDQEVDQEVSSSGSESETSGPPTPAAAPAAPQSLLWSRRGSAAQRLRMRENEERLEAFMEQGKEIAELVCADGFLREYGYDTRLNPLSGGQRQRLCLGRAIARGGSIIILDEATSALDESTEARVTANLFEHFDSSQTVIIIAHRLSTIRAADMVAVIGRPEGEEGVAGVGLGVGAASDAAPEVGAAPGAAPGAAAGTTTAAGAGPGADSGSHPSRPPRPPRHPAASAAVTASQGDFSVGSRVLEIGTYQELMEHGRHFLSLCKSLQDEGPRD